MTTSFSCVGKSLPRLDARGKTTGDALYGADMKLPGMLYGKILRSPFPHARILSIDTSRARRLSGVKAVITGGGVGERRYGLLRDETVLATDKVRFVGDRIAAVAAVSVEVAEEALSLIDVQYEELSPIFDPLEAMQPEVPLIHEHLEEYAAAWKAIKYGNVCSHTRVRRGDGEEGFRKAEIIVEETFTTPIVHQGYLEPNVAVAAMDSSGKMTIWSSTQSPFGFRAAIADILEVPLTRVRVIATAVGGGFGGKGGVPGSIMGLAACALLSRETGRPVMLSLSREEEFIAGTPRHPAIIKLRIGARWDGTLVVGEAKAIFDSGATAGWGPMAMSNCCRYLFGAYRIPHLKIDGYCVYTNKISGGACRAPGSPQASFAMESVMDILAEKLAIDALEFRLKNALVEGDASPTGQVMPNIGLRESLIRVKGDWEKAGKGWNRGKGVACGVWHGGGVGASGCQMKLNTDGTIVVATGAVDIGQGSTTVIAQMVAEEMGVPVDDITMVTADTDATPYDLVSGASRVTFTMGKAARIAAQDAKRQIVEMAADILEAKSEDLELRDRSVHVKGSPDKRVSLAQLGALSHSRQGGPILGRGSLVSSAPPYDPGTIEGAMSGSDQHPLFAVQVVEVEVDMETGVVRVLDLLNAQDVGFAINPQCVEGQIEGGAAQGLGYALSEGYVFDQGEVRNPNFGDYRIPSPVDIPTVRSLFVEKGAEDGPFGAKGVGEPPIVPTAAAVANAVYSAVGVRITDLPITPEKVLKALRDRSEPQG
ncbi:MAG: molybdopterin-dependent oxidoreductase [Chloroflexi bacterium]|nr:molybdopterin-dependent oxidoreductase [Chloroflexota bacterium]